MKFMYGLFVPLLMLGLFFPARTEAQQQGSITGLVTNAATLQPLSGVLVSVVGSDVGALTNPAGRYTITNAPAGQVTLATQVIGFAAQQRTITVPAGATVTADFELVEAALLMDELVVVAYGQQAARSLGVAVGRVSGEEMNVTREPNLARTLAGRISGVQVNSSAGGSQGSSNVVIRGATSLGSGQQPLYVVDGVPIDNRRQGGQGRDYGDGVAQINPHDIADISVLKGPAAAALYGERGAQGVILITTKTGEHRTGIGVEVTSSYMAGQPLVLPRLQNVYGQGDRGQFRFFDADGTPQLSTINDGPQHPRSWGPRMDGQPVYTWEGKLEPFSPQGNHFADFYRTERTFDNAIAIAGGTESTLFRLSLNQFTNQSLVPTNDMTRRTVTFNGSHQASDRIRAEARVSYINQEAQNRQAMGDNGANVSYSLRGIPRNVSLESLRTYEITEDDVANPRALHGYGGNIRQVGWERQWTAATVGTAQNPYFWINNRQVEDTRDRVMGHVSLSYDFVDWATASVRAGTDYFTDRLYSFNDIGSRGNLLGSMSDQIRRLRENTVDAVVTVRPQPIVDGLSAGASLGATYNTRWTNDTGNSGSQFILPKKPFLTNTQVRAGSFGWSERETQSLFAFGNVNWRDVFYVNWTGRNDWSSTLPVDNNSYFYPSISTNFVWSDAFDLRSDVLAYGSVRAAWAQAGASGGPYQLSGAYGLGALPFQGQPIATFTNNLPFLDLRNELTTSVEFGGDLAFFDRRLELDATWYHSSTANQILNISVARSSGFNNVRVNAGEITNRGIELMLTGVPILTPNLQWETRLTSAKNKNEVVSLTEGVERFQIGSVRNLSGVFADPGQPLGAMYASHRWVRDEQGNRLIHPETGLPLRETGDFLVGNAQPDWTGGILNTVQYRGVTLTGLVDMRFGGEIFSTSNIFEAMYGTGERTLHGREGDFVAEGMVAQQNADGEWVSTGVPNTRQITAQEYWVPTATQETAITEEFISSASYVAMREISIGTAVPASLVQRFGFNRMNVSLVGRNLGYFLRHTDGFSPETAQFNLGNNGYGIEYGSMPMTRSIGLNVNIGM